jgi:hypothetical protein
MKREKEDLTFLIFPSLIIIITIAVIGLIILYKVPTSQFAANIRNSLIAITSFTTSTIPTTTITSTTTQNVTTPSYTVNATWANEFIENITPYRASALKECTHLDEFAQLRFNAMASDYPITDYGYQQNLSSSSALVGTGGNYYEEYFQPGILTKSLNSTFWIQSGVQSPSEDVQEIKGSMPNHWAALTSSNYAYYGYAIGNASWIVPTSGSCNIGEIGINQNLQDLYANAGCPYSSVNQTWFVVELGSICQDSTYGPTGT